MLATLAPWALVHRVDGGEDRAAFVVRTARGGRTLVVANLTAETLPVAVDGGPQRRLGPYAAGVTSSRDA